MTEISHPKAIAARPAGPAAWRASILTAAVVMVVTSGGPGAAQQPTPSASQLVPRSLAPEVRRTPTGVALPGTPAETAAPPGADRITLRVGDVTVEGGEPELAAETAQITGGLRGRTITVTEAYGAAANLERAYNERGYFLTRVVVPPQDVRQGGTLRLRVLAGFIEDVDASSLPPQVRRRVEQILAPIVNQRRLAASTFERQVLLAGEVPGLTLRSTLAPGTQLGGVRLVLQGQFRPFNFDVSGDNSLSRSLGFWQATVSGAVNSPLGFGEQVYANVSGSPGHEFLAGYSPRRLFAAGVVVPIGIDGLSFNAEGAFSITKPRRLQEFGLPTENNYNRVSLRMTYPVVRTRTDTVVLRGTFDMIEETQTAPTFNDALIYEDRYRVLRAGFDWTRQFSQTRTQVTFGADISQGIRGLDSRGLDDATPLEPLSRDRADDIFTKVEGRLRVLQPLWADFGLELTARGQYALTGPLLSGERFSLGGPRSLSAFDAGALSGDSGWLVRSELFYGGPLTSIGNFGVIPYLFAARGQSINDIPSAVENRVVGSTNLGIGARASVLAQGPIGTPQSYELGLEAARQFNDGILKDQWRINVNGAIRF